MLFHQTNQNAGDVNTVIATRGDLAAGDLVAWLRVPGGKWQLVATGADADVWQKLRAEAGKHAHCDTLVKRCPGVIAAGRDVDPNGRRG